MTTPDLITYVRKELATGTPKEVISARLSAEGWSPTDIAEAFQKSISVPSTSTQHIHTTVSTVDEAQTQNTSGGNFWQQMRLYAPSVLRYSMSLVILWFGIQQFIDTQSWLAYVPDSAVTLTHLSTTTLVYINGTIEVVFGTLLIFGWQTRIVALILALHLLDIMYIVGYGEIGIRDFGLAMGTFTIFMNGYDMLAIGAPTREQ
jgi:uncharacterized membrane protein YphA (DoxX/SURF4 family)